MTDWNAIREATDRRIWRVSPDLPGLSLLKRAVLSAYAGRVITLRFAQRLIDRCKLWEA